LRLRRVLATLPVRHPPKFGEKLSEYRPLDR
jgi:hypothetical protein